MPAKTATKKQQRTTSAKGGNGVKKPRTKKTQQKQAKKAVVASPEAPLRAPRRASRKKKSPLTSKQLYVKHGHSTPTLDATLADYSRWLDHMGSAADATLSGKRGDGPFYFMFDSPKMKGLIEQIEVPYGQYGYATHRSKLLDYNYNRLQRGSGIDSVTKKSKEYFKALQEVIATRTLVLAWNMCQADGRHTVMMPHVNLAESLLGGVPSSGNYPMTVSTIKRRKRAETVDGSDAATS